MRDNPGMMKSAMGMMAYPAAIKKIKGTAWEAVLFSSNKPDKDLIEFRRKCDEMDKANKRKEDEKYAEIAHRSEVYVLGAKRAKSELTSAKEIIAGLFAPPSDGPDDVA